jgi:valyl-tRNA synthetase
MDRYEFALVGNELYSFIWDDFCSWYIELAKAGLSSDDQQVKLATQSTLITILLGIIKLLHPFMPFVSEEIYQYLPHKKDALCIEDWPTLIDMDTDAASEKCQRLISIIKGIREVKIDALLKPNTELSVAIKDESGNFIKVDELMAVILLKMTHTTWVDELDGELMVKPINNGVLYIPQDQVIDKEAEKIRLTNEQEKLTKEIQRAQAMLQNPNFVSKAPEEKVNIEKNKLEEYQRQYELIITRLKDLNNE